MDPAFANLPEIGGKERYKKGPTVKSDPFFNIKT